LECPLCRLSRELDRYTKPIYEDSEIIVTQCKTCKVPLGVLKLGHNAKLEAKRYLVMKMEALFPGKFIDQRMRQIPEHFHVHAR